MPYEWLQDEPAAPDHSGAVSQARAELRAWPQRSSHRRGLAAFVAMTAALLAVPLVSLLGTVALWVLLPFLGAALAGLIWALRINLRRGEVQETLTLVPGSLTLLHSTVGREPEYWQANPQWVRLHLLAQGGPVPDYLTLSGGGRVVELGAFLTAEERRCLHDELARLLARR
ncbi:DUF2244 domain-containing protein [Phaeovulum sp.]|uniref:DUF2244 domain-containing protein n=1 Tax=Phaeovulum sp. TaxID=2934796 RepID=UPI00273149E7|nr:DUF2244 domain-containing protein [Phaeovulum sp.]MDP1668458.1 DUF2244 domain-containing protein [Phaeovulum sp.]MDP2063363.1 DUF2244 domain-containing protein [Phaeovulum sp.]MDZ4118901.1 DUF2244 domain-containing protein [Phaeovulum sp.]